MNETTRLRVRVEFHMSGGYTHVQWLNAPAMAESGRFEVPTHAIPFDLRRVGSEFVVVLSDIDRTTAADAEELRRRIRDSVTIERLTA